MNIFAVDNNAVLAATMLCDKHVVKMIVESAQILSTVSYLRGVHDAGLYKPTHIHHPCTKWTEESVDNYSWLTLHGFGLSSEYTKRYGKIHKTESVLKLLESQTSVVWGTVGEPDRHTPFVQAIPEQYRSLDSVEAYRNFYRAEKSRFAKWRYTEPPEWWQDGKSEVPSN